MTLPRVAHTPMWSTRALRANRRKRFAVRRSKVQGFFILHLRTRACTRLLSASTRTILISLELLQKDRNSFCPAPPTPDWIFANDTLTTGAVLEKDLYTIPDRTPGRIQIVDRKLLVLYNFHTIRATSASFAPACGCSLSAASTAVWA
jgi:hypothetical protein